MVLTAGADCPCSCEPVRALYERISLHSRQKFSSDAGDKPLDAARVDDEAIRRAAFITLRRAICERFPPGAERRAWLRWVLLRFT
jgi:hypothetical protein